MVDSIPPEWLGSAVPVEDVEDDNIVDGVPFGDQVEAWEQFRAAMLEEDEICCFCSPPDSRGTLWPKPAGMLSCGRERSSSVSSPWELRFDVENRPMTEFPTINRSAVILLPTEACLGVGEVLP